MKMAVKKPAQALLKTSGLLFVALLVFCPANAQNASGIRRVVVLGDSIAAGYGLGSEESFPALLQQRIDSEGYAYEVINAGVGGDTTAGGLRRIDWLLKQPMAVLILELGGNDALRGLPLADTRSNLASIIEKARQKYPGIKILIAGMKAPPNIGQSYVDDFAKIYPELAATTKSSLVPFLLENVGGDIKLNQADGIHPTAAGQKLVADNVWTYLKPLLEKSP